MIWNFVYNAKLSHNNQNMFILRQSRGLIISMYASLRWFDEQFSYFDNARDLDSGKKKKKHSVGFYTDES